MDKLQMIDGWISANIIGVYYNYGDAISHILYLFKIIWEMQVWHGALLLLA